MIHLVEHPMYINSYINFTNPNYNLIEYAIFSMPHCDPIKFVNSQSKKKVHIAPSSINVPCQLQIRDDSHNPDDPLAVMLIMDGGNTEMGKVIHLNKTSTMAR